MAQPDPRPPHRGAIFLVGAALGALTGAAGLRFGPGLWQRLRSGHAETAGEDDFTSGRGLPDTPPTPKALHAGYETTDMQGGTLGKCVAVLFGVAAASIAGMVFMLGAFEHVRMQQAPPSVQQQVQIAPPLPRLAADPKQEYDGAMQVQDKAMADWSWNNAAHSQARIPVDRAMSLSVGHSLDEAP